MPRALALLFLALAAPAQVPAPPAGPTSAAPARFVPSPDPCRFEPARLQFAGSPVDQARCLLRKVRPLGIKEDQPLPPVLERLLDRGGAPDGVQKEAALAAFPEPYQTYARRYRDWPASRTQAGLPLLYFVIHDTSQPFLKDKPFPGDLDRDRRINAMGSYMDQTFGPSPVAHIFLNRTGQIWAGHDFSEGWRATKLESRVAGPAARGRFAHIELVQPRRYLEGFSDPQHTQGPIPGFSDEQYRLLAALYVYASARAERWLIPAFHSTIDHGLPDGHDDPQNFELERFGMELERLLNPPQTTR